MFRGIKLSPLAMAIAIALSSSAFAQENSSKNEDNQSDTEKVTVWGTKVTSNSVYMDEEALATKQADHISDLLRTIPGVDVGGAHSLNQRITIRSMDDKDLRITIDGANQNTYMYHHMGNLQIHADILKSVDVNVGKNSVVDGGLGGSVRFETKEAEELLSGDDKFGGRIQASYNDNASNSVAISLYGQASDSVDLLFYHNDVSRNNYEVGGGKILDETGTEIDGTDGAVRGLEGDLQDTLVKVSIDINDTQRLKFGYESYKDEGNYSYRPDMGLATDLAIAEFLNIPLVYPTEFTRDTFTVNYDIELDNTILKFAAFTNTSTLWRDERGLITWRPPFAVIKEGEAKNSGLNLIAQTDLANHQFIYGFDRIKYDTSYIVDGINAANEEATSTALYLEDRVTINDKFAVIPGIRYEMYDINSTVVNNDFDDVTFGITGEYQVTSDFLIRASSTQLFKGPEIGEVFIGAGLYDRPNAEISAETGTNTEISFAFQSERDSGNKIRSGITLFSTNVNDFIYDYAVMPTEPRCRIDLERCVYWKDNVGDLEIDGFEAYIGYTTGNLDLLLTLSDAESELNASADYSSSTPTQFQNLDGARIDRQQGQTISFNLDYQFDSTDLSLHWDFLVVDDVAAGLDLDGATLSNDKDGFTVHNIAARWFPDLSQGLSVTFGIDNVFDEFYASQSSRTGVSFHPLFQELYLLDYEPGRNAKLTIAYEF